MPEIRTPADDIYGGIPETGFYTVAVVLATQQFGGPQEGGWWIDCYEPDLSPEMPTPQIHTNEREAYEAAKRLEAELVEHNVGRREKSSMASNGVYEMHVFDGFPRFVPEVWPRYE